jgi:hypothetical protein
VAIVGVIAFYISYRQTEQSLRGEEADDLAHHALALIRLEEILCVRRALKNDQLFWVGSFLVLFANSDRYNWVATRGSAPSAADKKPIEAVQ